MNKVIEYPDDVEISKIKAEKSKLADIKTSVCFTVLEKETELKSELFKRESLKISIENGGPKKACFCLMNPSKADEKESDNTVNAIIELVYKKRKDHEFKDVGEITIVNVLPFYETSSSLLHVIINYFGENHKEHLKEIIQKNQKEILENFKASDLIVIGWGDRPEKLHAVNYDIEIDKILCALYKVQKRSNVYIFESKNKKGITKKMNPRHPNRLGLTTLKLTKVEVKENTNGKRKYKVDIL